jgi:hypothetical protein
MRGRGGRFIAGLMVAALMSCSGRGNQSPKPAGGQGGSGAGGAGTGGAGGGTVDAAASPPASPTTDTSGSNPNLTQDRPASPNMAPPAAPGGTPDGAAPADAGGGNGPGAPADAGAGAGGGGVPSTWATVDCVGGPCAAPNVCVNLDFLFVACVPCGGDDEVCCPPYASADAFLGTCHPGLVCAHNPNFQSTPPLDLVSDVCQIPGMPPPATGGLNHERERVAP